MKLALSDAYKLVKILDEKRKTSVLGNEPIDGEILDADINLGKNLQLFEKYVTESLACIEGGSDEDALLEKIMYMRIQAMSISTAFDNFVDVFDKVIRQ